jgi:DMSO/TMAO reductase YedYZ molybdopterin-dependent catalytic subunit
MKLELEIRRAAQNPRTTTHLGLWLALTFGTCLITGLLSHGIQHPDGWFFWPSRPVNLYRITQGTHVLSGLASIPLLGAKLWSVHPKLFQRPAIRSIPHLVERLSVLALTSSALFELVTGLFNIAQNYPWRFFFPAAHFAVAWVVTGAILVHIAVKLPIIRVALGERTQHRAEPERGQMLDRRGFLSATALSVGAALAVTAGSSVPLLRATAVLSNRSERGPQRLPVNRTAAAAGVSTVITDPNWRLEINAPSGARQLSLAELHALPQVTARLPIACVEGWSQDATWTGVRIADLVGEFDRDVRVLSAETTGLYSTSVLPAAFVRDPLTLLALDLDGAPLHPDHGYPCRLIAPNRPGVLQTKWVRRLEIL